MKKLILFAFLTISSSVFADDIFTLKATTGTHVFNGIFIYEGCAYKNVKGSLTVPGVFTSPLEESKCSYSWNGEYVRFKVKFHENNQEYYVYYFLSIVGNSITGTMKVDGELVASIAGELIYSGK